MSFTVITITGNYGASATGSFIFTLTQAMANSDQVLVPSPISATLSEGQLSVELQSNVDPATTPQGVVWGVTEVIAGAQPRDYFVEVPSVLTDSAASTTSGSPYVQLSTVTAAMWMLGLPISGAGIPANATVAQVLQQLNQLQLSAPATATGVTSVTVGSSAVDIAALMPTELGWA